MHRPGSNNLQVTLKIVLAFGLLCFLDLNCAPKKELILCDRASEIDSLIAAARRLTIKNYDSAMQLNLIIREISIDCNYCRGVVKANNGIILGMLRLGNPSDSTNNLSHQSITLSIQEDDPELLSESYFAKAAFERAKMNFVESYRSLILSKRYAKNLPNKSYELYATLALGDLLSQLENMTLSEIYMKEGFDLAKENLALQLIIETASMLENERYEAVKDRLNGILIDTVKNEFFKLRLIEIQANANYKLGNHKEALIGYKKLLLQADQLSVLSSISLAYTGMVEMAWTYFRLGHVDSARLLLSKVSSVSGYKSSIAKLNHTRLLIELDKLDSNWSEAFRHQELLVSLNDSMKNLETVAKIAAEDVSRINKSILLLQEKVNRKDNSIYLLLACLVIALFGSIAIWIVYRKLQMANNKLIREQKTIEFLNNNLEDIVRNRTSELERASAKLKLSYEVLASRNRQLTNIAWRHSHIIRAPFARLSGLLQLLNRDFSHKSIRELMPKFQIVNREIDLVIREIVEIANQQEGDTLLQITDKHDQFNPQEENQLINTSTIQYNLPNEPV